MSGWKSSQQRSIIIIIGCSRTVCVVGPLLITAVAKDGAPSAVVGKQQWCNQKYYHVICHATYLAVFRSLVGGVGVVVECIVIIIGIIVISSGRDIIILANISNDFITSLNRNCSIPAKTTCVCGCTINVILIYLNIALNIWSIEMREMGRECLCNLK